ncbi:MAG: sugar transferase [Deltaproteobacteria bacterium]|nr:sugar transferase [Deltaproteobacteria bacterium]
MNKVSTDFAGHVAAAPAQPKSFWRPHFGRLITLSQITADFVTVLATFLLSYFLYIGPLRGLGPVTGDSPQRLPEFTMIAAASAVLYILLLEREKLYRREISLLNVKEMRGIFHVGIYAAAAVLSVMFYIRSTSFSRVTFTLALTATPVLLYFQRQVFYRMHVLFHQRGLSQKRVLIYGAGSIGTHLAKRLFDSPSLGLLPTGFLDDDAAKAGQSVRWTTGNCPRSGIPVLGGESSLPRALADGVELVFIALPSATFDRNQKLVERCVELGVPYAIVPNAYEKFIQRVESFEIGGIPLIRRRDMRVSLLYLMAKRLIDFVLATVFLVVLSPLVLFIGIAIKWDSKGPILFKQKRTGLNGREFSFYKFRSMYVDAPKYARTPADPNDPRITKVGRWIRRTSLDELPQLFNVFRGDMSLVGPRPEMPFIVESYGPLERQRLLAKPGITGVWQISAVRGEPIHANIEFDLFYIENRSVLLDLAIIIKTILSVIRGVGAY